MCLEFGFMTGFLANRSRGLATKVVPVTLGLLGPDLLCPEILFSVLVRSD